MLHLFASSDELASELQLHGVGCTTAGIHRYADLHDDATYQHGMAQAGAGVYAMVVAHVVSMSDGDEVPRRVVAIIAAACRRGASYVLESPAEQTGVVPDLELELRRQTDSSKACFARCRLGSTSQQATTVIYSAGLVRLDSLAGLHCQCRGLHAAPSKSRPYELTVLAAMVNAERFGLAWPLLRSSCSREPRADLHGRRARRGRQGPRCGWWLRGGQACCHAATARAVARL